ncbi:MAG: heparinase II/III family protein, partial [Phycisphaeraceae bacterium]|nr:heparinase II/III family protein [Phycisphaeraceae bacterium]
MHCKYCAMVFPNEQYPLTESVEVIHRAGEKETWRFHHNDKTKDQYYFEARARYFAKQYMADRLLDMARVDALSGDEAYGRRAALLLRRFAEVFPRWCVVHDYPSPDKKYPVNDAKPPYSYWAGIWDRWHLYDTPKQIALAYDLVYDQVDDETRRMVENDLLRADVAFQRTYTGKLEPYNRVAPQRSAGFILIGRVINEPDFVHEGVQRIGELCAQDFHFDGMHRMGTPSYHIQMVNNCKIAAGYARGYSDPPGYGKGRFDDLDLLEEVATLGMADMATKKMTLPNGLVVPVHDAWSRDRSHVLGEHALGPMLLNSYGHGRLDFGATQAHLNFSGGDGHRHFDNLSLILFAHGEELLSDIGYTHTPWRFWPTQSPSHNTVVVDGKLHHTETLGGNLRWFDATGNVQVIEASQPRTYPGVTDVFRRRLITVRVDETRAYVVDVFTVRGGAQHDYFLHGHCAKPQAA